ncbi:MAG: 3'-5' exonuclease [Bacteroidales bacterium]
MSSKKTEQEEKKHLNWIISRLEHTRDMLQKSIQNYSKDVQEFKDYMWEHKSGMDHVEKVSVRESITQKALTGEKAQKQIVTITKQIPSPYFGRIDFTEHDANSAKPIYIGINSFFDFEKNDNLIHDWRAPISSMFYDYEIGEAEYEAPNGTIGGEISLKRQYRIKNKHMEFVLESSMHIHDDILQQELSRATDEKMKNIVATIQRNQNAIIRNDTDYELIIQGVAGSGKTSIALHRIAFLLYKHKDTISAQDILIISPNKVFADYISGVLPELGEENIPEMGIEEFAEEILDKNIRFQSFFDQTSQILEKHDQKLIERIQFKSDSEFVSNVNRFINYIEEHFFTPNDLQVDKYFVPNTIVAEKYQTFRRVPLFKRFRSMAEEIARFVTFTHTVELRAKHVNKIEADIKKMFRITQLKQLYKELFIWLEKPEMLKVHARSVYEFLDIFGLAYMKIKLEGSRSYHSVKHLIIDEMQDYAPIQYAVLTKLFPCKKTILGDSNQSVTTYSSSSHEKIQEMFPGAHLVKLCKSYRSSFEITEFAQKILPNADLETVERHGKEPEIVSCSSHTQEIKKIVEYITEFNTKDFGSMGIICKTNSQAEILHEELSKHIKCNLLSPDSITFVHGVQICSVHLSKGLEFDSVVIPYATEENYHTETDKHLLYIGCTRAMHELYITYTKHKTPFLPL